MPPPITSPSKDNEFRLSSGWQSPSPPPYEAQAYPKAPRRRFLLRKLVSLQVLLALGLTLTVSWLCLVLERETKLRNVAHHATSSTHISKFEESLKQCTVLKTFPARPKPQSRKRNPRWNSIRGQNGTTILTNVTFFDGESILHKPMDVTFDKGLIIDVSETGSKSAMKDQASQVYNLHGRWVTPGLVDMHSHHSIGMWPATEMNGDVVEINPLFGPLTPFLRALDGMRAFDIATPVIMSGGITSSLIIPGSANIMGGEGTVIKNVLKSGEIGEYVMEELLLEHGVPVEERHRYMKMACGENPMRIYSHTRQANAWILRKHLARATELKTKQDEYCAAAVRVAAASVSAKDRFMAQMGDFPTELELESTVGMLRGRVAMQNHCYMPEDMETMLRISHEFGFRVRAFHHAIEAWQVPTMLKEYGENITIATFSDFSLYKWEAYFPSLYAGAILDRSGVSVAYKSDHVTEETNAKYLMSQAAAGHSFHLNATKALQSVTSIPAKAIDLDYRIGYAREGYDADLVVWDDFPLSIGATPLQVYIDGVPQLEPVKVKKSLGVTATDPVPAAETPKEEPKMRVQIDEQHRQATCSKTNPRFIISGIKKSFLDNWPKSMTDRSNSGSHNWTLVISDGSISCFGLDCREAISELGNSNVVRLSLSNGHLIPGLTAMTGALGMVEISSDPTTGDGIVSPILDARDPANVDYAKYGVNLKGKAFTRARMGGITRAVTAPYHTAGFLRGVSVGILTGQDKTLLDGGVFQDDVALHVVLDDEAKATEFTTISGVVKTLRDVVASGKGKYNETIYGKVATGELPLIIAANNQYDIQQIILFKKDFPDVKVVLQGGSEAPLVAKELAAANIPILLTKHRPAPVTFRHRDAVVGPPLTPSVAKYLSEAGVFYAIAIVGESDSHIHALALEAAWAAKYAQLSDREAVRLVSTNVESILGLKPSRDFVVWEGSPLQHGGTVALAFHENGEGKFELSACWPDEDYDDDVEAQGRRAREALAVE